MKRFSSEELGDSETFVDAMGDSGFTFRTVIARPSGGRQTSKVRVLAIFHDTAPNVDHTRRQDRLMKVALPRSRTTENPLGNEHRGAPERAEDVG
jgi:hypothetical protein